MKITELKKLIREEFRKVVREEKTMYYSNVLDKWSKPDYMMHDLMAMANDFTDTRMGAEFDELISTLEKALPALKQKRKELSTVAPTLQNIKGIWRLR